MGLGCTRALNMGLECTRALNMGSEFSGFDYGLCIHVALSSGSDFTVLAAWALNAWGSETHGLRIAV